MKAEAFSSETFRCEARLEKKPLALYIHWPFCLSKCPYCDFNSHVRNEPIDEARFLRAYRAELDHRFGLTQDRSIASIFFGGGTPSLMSAHLVGGILDAVAARWPVESQAEITLEANPTSVETNRFTAYRSAGVNRVSLGIQALNAQDLKALGRQHSVEEALRALEIAAQNFERFSFDLIYARPGQSIKEWEIELLRALGLAKDHVSLYQLTLEQGTLFEKLAAKGAFSLPGEELGRDFWDVTQEIMEAAGMSAYEVSNHAKPGSESQHNLIYWRYGEYAGIGPGAHGRILSEHGRYAQSAEKQPEIWLKNVEAQGHGLVENEVLTSAQQADEFLLMGLRLNTGIDLLRFQNLAGKRLEPVRIKALIEDDLVEVSESYRLRVTKKGRPLLNSVIAYLAV